MTTATRKKLTRITRPKIKHPEFAPTMFRLVGDDWILILWCPANRQSCLFLAEPERSDGLRNGALPGRSTATGLGKGEVTGYWVTALERVGESASALPGLPRSFKTVMGAAEWLEARMSRYNGDTFERPAEPPP